MLSIRLGGADKIDLSSIRLHLVDTDGKNLVTDISTERLDSDDVRNATILPPAEPFKIKLTGCYATSSLVLFYFIQVPTFILKRTNVPCSKSKRK